MKRQNIIILLLVGASLLMSSCVKTPKDPKLIVSADTLVFKGNETLSLYVTTNNTEGRDFYVNYPYDWVRVTPQSGHIAEGDTVKLTLTSYSYDPMEVWEDYLYISSAYDEKRVKLIGLPEDFSDYALTEALYFPEGQDDAVMHISNYGNTTLDYSITASTTFANYSPSSGQIAMMQQADINVSIDREGLLGEVNPALYVTVNGTTDTVPIILEKKLMLPNDVIDAEYAKATDLLVYVAANTTLNIFHPDTREISTVALSYTPTCISISPDGTKAVVGHDAHVTYVDLMAETLLTTNDISCSALDIVLTNDGWTYVFPRRDQWEHIRCINVTTNNAMETLHTGNSIYAGTKAKLHPSGKFVYGADNGLSPADIEKYDIQDGTAHYLYDSPYHGDYSMGGDLWFDQSGERVFCRAGTVFKTSETQSMDMIYNGTLTLEGSYRTIAWLDQLDLKREIYLVTKAISSWYDDEPNPPYVYVYNSDNLMYKTKRRLEDYSVANSENGNTVYDAIPYFVFAHSTGTKVYVITKANGSGMVHEWAIQTIDLP